MSHQCVFQYSFSTCSVLEVVDVSLLMALVAVESLHGEARVRLEARHYLDREQLLLMIDATTSLGCDLNKLITGFLMRELGADAFTVKRVDSTSSGGKN